MPPDQSAHDTGQPTVLIVEDEVALADLYGQWLDDYDVEITYTAEEALDRLTATIDIVFVDRCLPRLMGDKILETLQEKDLDCRVVVVSAITPGFDVIDLEFDDYLIKPITKIDLRNAAKQMQRRAQYPEVVQEFYRLAETKTALQVGKPEEELEVSDEYAALEADLESAQDTAKTTFVGLNEEEVATVTPTLDIAPSSPEIDRKEK